MSGLIFKHGVSMQGVGPDILSYMTALANYFCVTITVTSGYRSPDAQAQAMFDNWAKMKHGKIYKASTLPEVDRAKLDEYWTTTQDLTASFADKSQAQVDFLELAKTRVGSKSMHTQGRALDVSRLHIDTKVYQAITLYLHDVPEGKRTDIFHFESRNIIPQVDDAMHTRWDTIKSGLHHPNLHSLQSHEAWC